jgi:hypothetical protein
VEVRDGADEAAGSGEGEDSAAFGVGQVRDAAASSAVVGGDAAGAAGGAAEVPGGGPFRGGAGRADAPVRQAVGAAFAGVGRSASYAQWRIIGLLLLLLAAIMLSGPLWWGG